MRKQMIYEWKGRTMARIIALGSFIAASMLMMFLSTTFGSRPGFAVTPMLSVIFTSMGFVALLVVATVLAVDSGKRLFSKPQAYITMLAPVKGWKLLGARMVVIAIDYGVVLVVGIAAIVMQAYIMMSEWAVPFTYSFGVPSLYEMRTVITALISLFQLILMIFFARTLVASVFAGLPARKLLGVIVFFAAGWVWQCLNVAMIPFARGGVWMFGPFLQINMPLDTVASLCAYTLLSVVRLAALFVPTAYLIEKKMNL